MKTCSVCLKLRPLSEFNKRLLAAKKDGSRGTSYRSDCIHCRAVDRVCRKYDITKVEYFKLLDGQNGLCKICEKPETTVDSRYGKVRNLSLDHCHTTGKVRGFLCEGCNRAIGLLKEDPRLFSRSVVYLNGSL